MVDAWHIHDLLSKGFHCSKCFPVCALCPCVLCPSIPVSLCPYGPVRSLFSLCDLQEMAAAELAASGGNKAKGKANDAKGQKKAPAKAAAKEQGKGQTKTPAPEKKRKDITVCTPPLVKGHHMGPWLMRHE